MAKAIAAVFLVWAGLLLGVSFVATPAKFLAPSLPLPQALDVGRWTFHVLTWIEAPMTAVLAAVVFVAWQRVTPGARLMALCLAGIAAALAVQTFNVRPYLDARVLRIMAGELVPADRMHTLYIALEAAKLAFILTAGLVGLYAREASNVPTGRLARS
jgi:hypothetical protein